MNNAYEMKSYGWSFSRRNISSFLARLLLKLNQHSKQSQFRPANMYRMNSFFSRLVWCVSVWNLVLRKYLCLKQLFVCYESCSFCPLQNLSLNATILFFFFSLLWVDLLDEILELPFRSARLSKLDADKYRTKAEISIPTKNENASHSKRQQQQQHQIQNDLLPERSGNRKCTHSIADEGILLLPLKQRASGKTPNYYNTNNCFQSFIMRFNTS